MRVCNRRGLTQEFYQLEKKFKKSLCIGFEFWGEFLGCIVAIELWWDISCAFLSDWTIRDSDWVSIDLAWDSVSLSARQSLGSTELHCGWGFLSGSADLVSAEAVVGSSTFSVSIEFLGLKLLHLNPEDLRNWVLCFLSSFWVLMETFLGSIFVCFLTNGCNFLHWYWWYQCWPHLNYVSHSVINRIGHLIAINPRSCQV